MSKFVVEADGAPVEFDTAREAVDYAGRAVYLSPWNFPEHIERLEQTGRTAWAYGFSTVLITRKEAS